MAQQALSSTTRDSRRGWLRTMGGVSAHIAGDLLLIGIITLVVILIRPGLTGGELPWFGNNWLVKIFVLHAGFSDVHADLHGWNLLDIAILLLVSLLCLGLSTTFTRARKAWSLVAFALSLIAILLFLVTQIAGRSTVMLAVLILSLAMLGKGSFSRVIGYLGILAGILMFAGDLTVGVHSDILTVLFGAGYVLLTIWFAWIGRRPFGPSPVRS